MIHHAIPEIINTLNLINFHGNIFICMNSLSICFFFKACIYLFIAGCAGWVFVAACGLSLAVASRGYALVVTRASHCGGFSCCGSWTLGLIDCSSCGSQAVEGRLSSCGTWA